MTLAKLNVKRGLQAGLVSEPHVDGDDVGGFEFGWLPPEKDHLFYNIISTLLAVFRVAVICIYAVSLRGVRRVIFIIHTKTRQKKGTHEWEGGMKKQSWTSRSLQPMDRKDPMAAGVSWVSTALMKV